MSDSPLSDLRTGPAKMAYGSEPTASKGHIEVVESLLDNPIKDACHPYAGAMLIFSVPFQFYRMSPKRQ